MRCIIGFSDLAAFKSLIIFSTEGKKINLKFPLSNDY